jgi:hypothetical protein
LFILSFLQISFFFFFFFFICDCMLTMLQHPLCCESSYCVALWYYISFMCSLFYLCYDLYCSYVFWQQLIRNYSKSNMCVTARVFKPSLNQ